jgi:hypothetical protein
VTAVFVIAGAAAACGGSSKPHTAPTTVTTSPPTTSTTTTTATSPSTSTTIDSPIGAQAFAAYQRAEALLAQIEGSPTGRSTDPRLAKAFVDPRYAEVRTEIDALRLKDFVLRGPFSYSNFKLDNVTADGRIIFTVCEFNDQQLYDGRTGAPVTYTGSLGGLVVTPGAGQIPAQAVVYHPTSTSPWLVADDNTNTAGSASACKP